MTISVPQCNCDCHSMAMQSLCGSCCESKNPAAYRPISVPTESRPQLFVKNPVQIEAFHYTGTNAAQIMFWIGSSEAAIKAIPNRLAEVNNAGDFLIRTLESGEGYHIADKGDWIIKGIKGEFYPCKPDIFAETYRAASSSLLPVPEELEKFRTALTKINDIRNSLVGFQSFNFSEHAYPLVAALDEAGFEGMPYPEAMKRFGTMLERTLAAEARVKELESVASLPVGESTPKFAGCGESAELEQNQAGTSSSGDAVSAPPLSNEQPANTNGLPVSKVGERG